MTDIKIVKVPTPSRSKRPTLSKNYKKVVVNNRRKTKSTAAQLVLLPAYSKKLSIGDKKKADIPDLLGKNHVPKFYATFYESLFQ